MILWVALAFTAIVAAALLARDLHFVVRRRHRADAIVVGHERLHDDGSVVHTAVLAFTDHRGQDHRVVDGLLFAMPRPAVSTRVSLVYPETRPDLARAPRPILRAGIYLMVGYVGGVVIARLAGWLG